MTAKQGKRPDLSAYARKLCASVPVIPVLVIDDVASARPMAESLVRGGLPVLEVTLRTDAALDAIRIMSKVPGAIVGAGTLLEPADVRAVKEAGACFGVSPGVTDALLDAAEELDLPLLPGASTVSEVMRLFVRGYDMLKFFPAEAAGGIPMLKSIAGPVPQVTFCPTGGVNPGNLNAYRALPNVACVGGSWLTPKDIVASGDWGTIEQAARAASSS